MIRGIKSIAEYAVRGWMAEQGLSYKNFTLAMNGTRATITDSNGDTLRLRYDGCSKSVLVEEDLC